MSGNPAKTGTAGKVFGWACPNEHCDRYQGLVVGLWGKCVCDLCGTGLKRASAAVAVFRWEGE